MSKSHHSLDISPLARVAAGERFWEAANRGTHMAIGMHLLFGVLFYVLKVYSLVWLNVGSVSLYLLVLVLVQKRWERTGTVLVWFELLAHAAIARSVIGADSGFQYYATIPMLLIFLGTPRGLKFQLLLAVSLIAVIVFGDVAFHGRAPLIELPATTLDLLRRFNTVMFLAALGALAMFYAQSVDGVQRHLLAMATTDTLTGLSNRRRLIEVAEYELERAQRSSEPLAAIIVDVDRFKEINDAHGHVSGDDVLTEISRRLIGAVREQDTVARWGGEEFLILLPNTTLTTAAATAERIRLAVREKPIETGHALIAVTITNGVSEWQHGERMETCIARADRALYRGKTNGRDRTELAHDAQHVMDTPLELELELRESA